MMRMGLSGETRSGSIPEFYHRVDRTGLRNVGSNPTLIHMEK